MSYAVSKAGRRPPHGQGVNVTPILNLFMILIPALLMSFQIIQTSIINLELAGMGAAEGEILISPPTYFMTAVLSKTKDGLITCEFSRYRHIEGESIVVDTIIPKKIRFTGWAEVNDTLSKKLDSLHTIAKGHIKSFLDSFPDTLFVQSWREVKTLIAEPGNDYILDSVINRSSFYILISVDSIGENFSGENVTLNDLINFMRITRRQGFLNNYLQPPPWWPVGV